MRTKRTKTDEMILFDLVRGDEKDENPLGFVLFVLTLDHWPLQLSRTEK
jgi:hypothetical protein